MCHDLEVRAVVAENNPRASKPALAWGMEYPSCCACTSCLEDASKLDLPNACAATLWEFLKLILRDILVYEGLEGYIGAYRENQV